MSHRRIVLALCGALPPVAAQTQAASKPPARGADPPGAAAGLPARDGWYGHHWDSLTPDQRRQAEDRFGRGAQSPCPTPGDMRPHWESMTPGQRRGTLPGHGRGPHHLRAHRGQLRPG